MQQPPVVQQYGGAPIQGAPVPGAVIQGAVVPPQAQVQYVQQPQMVAQPQMVQPQMVQPQMVQPTMVVQQPVHQCFFALDRHPVRMECPFCRAQITTVMREEAGPSLAQWAACCGLCCIGLWPCACVPFCVSELRDVTHTCPQCQQRVGRVSQMSGSYDARRGQR
jgi:lipopolysaccharide-induced tumor necrosis factor-alpha factor